MLIKKTIFIVLMILAQNFMGQFCLQAQTIPFNQDCRDINGDLILDCTCTNINGDIVSCTDGTVLISGGATGGGTAGNDPGHDGIDNDGDGLVDEPDEADADYNGNIQYLRRSGKSGYKYPSSTPIDLDNNANPRIICYNKHYTLPKFEIILHYIWTHEGNFSTDDVINLKIIRKRDGVLLQNNVHYERTFLIVGNLVRIYVKFLPDIYNTQEEYQIITSVNNKFIRKQTIFLVARESDSGIYPSKRTLHYRGIR